MSPPPLTGAYEEIVLGVGLMARICPLRSCGNPMCGCRSTPVCLLAYGEDEADAWVVGSLLPEPEAEQLAAQLADDTASHDLLVANSILFGCPWAHFVGDSFGVLIANQAEAIQRTPEWFSRQPPQGLRQVRASIKEVDPLPVSMLLWVAHHYGVHMDGGDRRGLQG